MFCYILYSLNNNYKHSLVKIIWFNLSLYIIIINFVTNLNN